MSAGTLRCHYGPSKECCLLLAAFCVVVQAREPVARHTRKYQLGVFQPEVGCDEFSPTMKIFSGKKLSLSLSLFPPGCPGSSRGSDPIESPMSRVVLRVDGLHDVHLRPGTTNHNINDGWMDGCTVGSIPLSRTRPALALPHFGNLTELHNREGYDLGTVLTVLYNRIGTTSSQNESSYSLDCSNATATPIL